MYIVRLYQTFSYSVWPVIRADALLQQLENDTCDVQTLCLVLALCAATMAQLQLAPISGDDGGQWPAQIGVYATSGAE
jgi:hypothetical protein